jgi:hypothetical protein
VDVKYLTGFHMAYRAIFSSSAQGLPSPLLRHHRHFPPKLPHYQLRQRGTAGHGCAARRLFAQCQGKHLLERLLAGVVSLTSSAFEAGLLEIRTRMPLTDARNDDAVCARMRTHGEQMPGVRLLTWASSPSARRYASAVLAGALHLRVTEQMR